jgi:4-hydroxy-tetrahydrodipicolinate reductase
MTEIAVLGATGRMGKRIIALAGEHGCRVVAAIVSENHQLLGRDAGEVAGIGEIGVPLAAELTAFPNELVDFSAPPATRRWLQTCVDRRIPMLTGTTGLTPEDYSALDAAAKHIPVLAATNMSLGVAVLMRLVKLAASAVGEDCDIEIVEAHHRTKKDAPSGTALSLVEIIRENRSDMREIPVHSLRVADEVGYHTVYLALQGERIELTHRALGRDIFARGALKAARWLSRRGAGRYQILDVLEV